MITTLNTLVKKQDKCIEKLDKENGILEGKLADLQSEYFELENLHNNMLEERDKRIETLEKENAILKKALNLYINWADECDIAWDNFPDMKEKWWNTVVEKDLGWIEGLTFMVMEEAKEQFKKEDK